MSLLRRRSRVMRALAYAACLAMAAATLAAVPAAPARAALAAPAARAALTAPAAVTAYPPTNPGTDLAVSMSVNATASDVNYIINSVLAPALGLPVNAPMSSIVQKMEALRTNAVPTGGSPTPPTAPVIVLSAITTTVTETSPTTTKVTATVPASAIPSNSTKSDLAGLVASVSGIISMIIQFAICVRIGVATGKVGTTVPERAGLSSICLAIAYATWIITSYAINDAMVGVNLKSGVWIGIMSYVIVTALFGLVQSRLTGWIVANTPIGLAALVDGVESIFTSIKGWFSGPAGAGAAEAQAAAEAGINLPAVNPPAVAIAVAAAGLPQAEAIGAIQNVQLSGGPYCMDGGYGYSQPLAAGEPVAINICHANPNQSWQVWPNGNVTDDGWCLDTNGDPTISLPLPLELNWCNGSATQVWRQGTNLLGQPVIYNPLPRLFQDCVDDTDFNTTAGTQMQATYCNHFGDVAQEWFLPGGGTNGTSLTQLRVLPFGDSITAGFQSSDGSGYRCDLQHILTDQGQSFQFVGSLSGGTSCSQPAHEGHSGWTISQLASIESCTIKGFEPNLVLLDIGTNDVNGGGAPGPAATAEENLINSIFADDPGVTILVGGLIPVPNSTIAANMGIFNGLVSSWISQNPAGPNGGHVSYVDMTAVTTSDLADGLHPNDTGYQLMADAWSAGIASASNSGWISAVNPAGSGCTGVYTPPVWNPVGQIATGTGSASPAPGGISTTDTFAVADMTGDGKADLVEIGRNTGSLQLWINGGQDSGGAVNWQNAGTVATGVGAFGQNIRLADINGDGKADYLVVNDNGSVQAYLNGGSGCGGWCWNSVGTIAGGVGAPGEEVRFADVNGDGKADYLVVDDKTGATQAWLNGGSGCGGWCWNPQGTIASGVGGTGASTQFADVNGDGKADYLNIGPDGAVQAYLSGGAGCGGWCWNPVGTIATGVGSGSGLLLQFGDINGDGKADYLQVDNAGGIAEWQNGGGNSSGWSWVPEGQITQGSGASYQIQFADMDGDHRADWVQVNSDGTLKWYYNHGGSCGSGTCNWSWAGPANLNLSAGAPGYQVQLADINGDGKADYLVVNANGAVQAWLNGSTWTSVGTIATGVGAPGSQVRFADINGDGKADYLVVNASGAVQAWLNGGAGCGGWCWNPQGTIATGVGAPGDQIRLADLNGDGLADYIDVADNSSATLWLNGGPGCGGWCWSPKGQIAEGVGDPGSWIQFADINGDKKADYLAINPVTGATSGWLN